MTYWSVDYNTRGYTQTAWFASLEDAKQFVAAVERADCPVAHQYRNPDRIEAAREAVKATMEDQAWWQTPAEDRWNRWEDEYLTVPQFAQLHGLATSTVRYYVEKERIPAKKIGRQWFIPADTKPPADTRVKHGRYVKTKEDA